MESLNKAANEGGKYTQESLDAALEHQRQFCERVTGLDRLNSNVNAHYIIGGNVHEVGYTLCYGGLSKKHLGPFKGTELIIGQPHTVVSVEEKKALLKLDDYLLNRSGFSSAFITKNPEDSYRSGVIVDATCNVARTFGALIAHKTARAGQDGPKRTIMWNNLVKDGVDENLAFLISMLLPHAMNHEYIVHKGDSAPFTANILKSAGFNNWCNSELAAPTKALGTYQELGKYRNLHSGMHDDVIIRAFAGLSEESGEDHFHRLLDMDAEDNGLSSDHYDFDINESTDWGEESDCNFLLPFDPRNYSLVLRWIKAEWPQHCDV